MKAFFLTATRQFVSVAGLVGLVGFSASACALDAGAVAAPFELSDQRGALISLKHSAGKVVYLDFWASWCGPCQKSFPWMNSLREKYPESDFQIIAVNLDANREDANKFLAKNPAKFLVAFDPQGVTPRKYDAKGMPTSVLIGRDGKVLYTHMGFNDGGKEKLEMKIRAAVMENK